VDIADVTVADNATLEQSKETPPNGEPTLVKDTVPTKPLRASTLRLSVPIELAAMLIVVDVGVRLKSAGGVSVDHVMGNVASPAEGTLENPAQ